MIKKVVMFTMSVLAFAAGSPGTRANTDSADGPPLDWRQIEPDAVVWAVPHAGVPLKALFLCWNLGTAEAISVAHRLTMDHRAIEVGNVWNYGGVMKQASKRDEFLNLMREDYDVCVMAGGMSIHGFPPEMQYHLFEKLSAGMGLVYFYSSQDPLPEALRKKAKPAPREDVISGLPLSLFRTLVEAPDPSTPSIDEQDFYIPAGFSGRRQCFAAGDPLKRDIPAGSSLGESRVVYLPFDRAGYVTRPNFVYPGTYTKDMYIYDEYYISMLCKAMLWAAHRTPDIRVVAVDPVGASLPLGRDVSATVTIEAVNPTGLSLAYQVRDYQYRVHLDAALNVDLAQGTNRISLHLPLTEAGNYLLDVWLKDGDNVVDWGSGYFGLYGQGRITGIALHQAEALRRGQRLQGTVSVTNAAPGATVRLSLSDSYRRVVASRVFDVASDPVAFELPLHANLAGIMFNLRGELVLEGKTQFTADAHLSVPKERPDYLMTVAMGEDNSAFHLARLRRQRLEPYNFDGDHYISTAFQAATLAWDNREISSQHAAVGRVTGWTIPSLADEYVERAKKMARDLKPFGQRYAVLGDDSAPAGKITGIGDQSLRYHKAHLQKRFGDIAAFNQAYGFSLASWDELNDAFTRMWVQRMFQQYLRDRYGELAALNEAWGTSVDAWESIDQAFVDERKKENNVAPEVDLKRFGEVNYYDTYRQIKESAQAVNPDLALGHYASDIGRGLGEALETVNFLAPYWRDYHCEEIGAFYGKQPGYYGANGGYFDAAGTPPGRWLQPWYPLLSGLNNVVFWYTVERIPGDLALNPLRIGIWLDEANKIKSGIGKQVVMAAMHKDPVAILHSQASGFASEYDKRIAEIGNSRLSFNAIFHDLGLQYHYLSTSHLLAGVLAKEHIKLLVLPYCQALSRPEADTIRAFVRTGGTVLADLRPGVKTEHCRPLEAGRLDDVFGISRTGREDDGHFGRLSVVQPLPGLDTGAELADVRVDASVVPGTARSMARVGDSPAVIVNDFGEGRAVLLNFFIGQYALLQSDGRSGPLSALLDHVVRLGGVETGRIQARSGDGKAVRTRRVLFRNGSMDILGVCKRATMFEDFPVTIDCVLPDARHIYSMMDGTYFGLTNTVRDAFEPEQTKFYALLPYQVTRLEADVPVAVDRGGELSIRVRLATDGPPAATHVQRIQVRHPDGRLLKAFEAKVTTTDGRAALSLPVATDEAAGDYTLVVTDIPTGMTTEQRFSIR